MILGKHSAQGVVLSSTAYLSLGSGCPVIARDSNFFELMDREVLKYKDLEEFKRNLEDVFQNNTRLEENRKAAKRYVEENSAKEVAKRFIELFEELSS